LYDVVDVNSGAGNVTVDATGFGITCSYLTGIDINAQPTGDSESSFWWNVNFDGKTQYSMDPNRKLIRLFPNHL
jgi:hypothetical protein